MMITTFNDIEIGKVFFFQNCPSALFEKVSDKEAIGPDDGVINLDPSDEVTPEDECTGDKEGLDTGQRNFVVWDTYGDSSGHRWYTTTQYHGAVDERCYYCGRCRKVDAESGQVLQEW